MKQIGIKADRFRFNERKKDWFIYKDETFDANIVDLTDDDDDLEYFGGFVFVPRTAEHFCKTGRKTETADVANCQGVGPQSYGKTFEVIVYDCNHHLVPILFSHPIGTESVETWTGVFRAVQKIPGFDVYDRVTILDIEQSIDNGYHAVMNHAKIFLGTLHVMKNKSPNLGSEKSTGIKLYEKAVRAPSREDVEILKGLYGPIQAKVSGTFVDEELYRAY